MEQYISKSALVAEINKRIIDAPINYIGHQRVWAYNDVKDIIGTIEVKEVDLDSDIRTYLTNHFNVYEDGVLQSKKSELPLRTYDIIKIARHFFELGLRVSQPTTSVYGIEEALKENGIDPDSKEADIYREAIYKIYDRLKALKGE